jgi:hypothetical protein
MIKAHESKVVFCTVFVVPVEVGKLPFLHFIFAFEPEAETTPPPALEQNARLGVVRDRFSRHRQAPSRFLVRRLPTLPFLLCSIPLRPLCPDAFQQHRSRLVAGVLLDQLAAEGL